MPKPEHLRSMTASSSYATSELSSNIRTKGSYISSFRSSGPVSSLLNFSDRTTKKDVSEQKDYGDDRDEDYLGLELVDPYMSKQDTWAWVAEHDELGQAMKKGSVFFGFLEAPITFPPSFKWKQGRDAGNFTDLATLEGMLRESYCIYFGGTNIYSFLLIICKHMLTGAYITKKDGKDDKASFRPPSYTDRILCHSQSTSQDMLKIVKYDMCDAITPSDHRPVTASIDIFVKPLPLADSCAPTKDLTKGMPVLPKTTCLMKVRLSNLQLNWIAPIALTTCETPTPTLIGSASQSFGVFWQSTLNEGSFRFQGTGRSSSMDTINCMVYFPLQSEDPLAELRKAVIINHALNGSGQEGAILTARNMQYIHSFKLCPSDDRVLEFRSLCCSSTTR